MFNAEKKRSFLKSVCEIDRNNALHPLLSIEYENDAEGLPKRFSVHQDLFGYFNDNSGTGSPLPPVMYNPIAGAGLVTPLSPAVRNHFGFYNVDAQTPQDMYKGQNEEMDPALAKAGAISTIRLASGGSIH